MDRLRRSEVRLKVQRHESWLRGEKEAAQADFSGKAMRIVDLHGAILAKSIFANSRLNAVEFVGADLSDANFEHAKLTNVDFHNAIMNGTRLKGATLKNVHIQEECLETLREQLTPEQLDGMTPSYGRFMFMVFFTWS